MPLRSEYQELIDFFSDRELPEGPLHINDYSIFLSLPRAVRINLQCLHSDVEATSQSAARLLHEVKEWLINESADNQPLSE